MIYVFTTSNKWGSRLIRWGTGSKMSHMLIAKRAENESPIVESTWSTGVWQTTLSKSLKGRKIVLALRIKNLSRGELDALFLSVQKLIGKHYDWKGIAFWAVAIVWFNKILGRRLPPENKFADKDDFYCSELLNANIDFLLQIGVPIGHYGGQMIDPKRAAEILQESARIEVIDLDVEMKFNKVA